MLVRLRTGQGRPLKADEAEAAGKAAFSPMRPFWQHTANRKIPELRARRAFHAPSFDLGMLSRNLVPGLAKIGPTRQRFKTMRSDHFALEQEDFCRFAPKKTNK